MAQETQNRPGSHARIRALELKACLAKEVDLRSIRLGLRRARSPEAPENTSNKLHASPHCSLRVNSHAHSHSIGHPKVVNHRQRSLLEFFA